MNRFAVFFLVSLFYNTVNAQHTATHANMLWFNYNNTVFINDKWSIASDAQLRTRDWTGRWSQFALRTGVAYKINKKFTATAGFAWFGNVRYFNGKPIVPNEWRPWQEVAYQLKGKKINFTQRLRTEQRFQQQVVNEKKTQDYQERFRLRYRFEFGFPVNKEKITASIGNEVMVNPGHISDSVFFDQNRSFFFMNFKLTPATIFQFQFIKLFQWQAANRILDDQNVFRFSIHQQFHLRKKK